MEHPEARHRRHRNRLEGADMKRSEDGTFTGTHGFVQDDGSDKDGGSLTLSMPE